MVNWESDEQKNSFIFCEPDTVVHFSTDPSGAKKAAKYQGNRSEIFTGMERKQSVEKKLFMEVQN